MPHASASVVNATEEVWNDLDMTGAEIDLWRDDEEDDQEFAERLIEALTEKIDAVREELETLEGMLDACTAFVG